VGAAPTRSKKAYALPEKSGSLAFAARPHDNRRHPVSAGSGAPPLWRLVFDPRNSLQSGSGETSPSNASRAARRTGPRRRSSARSNPALAIRHCQDRAAWSASDLSCPFVCGPNGARLEHGARRNCSAPAVCAKLLPRSLPNAPLSDAEILSDVDKIQQALGASTSRAGTRSRVALTKRARTLTAAS
jgi:hypothetical protein